MIEEMTSRQRQAVLKLFREKVDTWSKLLRAIKARRISHSTILRWIEKEMIYLHHPGILGMIRENQTRSPAFRELVITAMEETIGSLQMSIRHIQRFEKNSEGVDRPWKSK